MSDRTNRLGFAVAALAGLTVPAILVASSVSTPHTFAPNTVISSTQMNDNFAAFQTAVNSKQDRVAGTCASGQFMSAVNQDGTVACGAVAVGVTGVTATAPLSSSGGAVPDISMSVASGTASGYLSSADWTTFNAKAPTASPTFTGTVTAPTFAGALSGNAATATDASQLGGQPPSFYQAASTALTTSSLTPSGAGRNGTATSVARSDHTHAPVTPVPLSSFSQFLGPATLGAVTLGSMVTLPAWTINAANACVLGATTVPPGTGGCTATPPVIRVLASASFTGPSNIFLANGGLVPGVALPTGHWGAPGLIAASFVAGQLIEVSNAGLVQGSFRVVGGTACAGPGDLFLVRVCGGAAGIQLFSVELVWN